MSIWQVSHIWKDYKHIRKRMTVQAKQRNEALVADWDFKMQQWDAY
jgi:hypothetical protein